MWGELEVPSEAADNPWLSSKGESGRITITVELERDGVAAYELNAFEEKSPQDVADRFAELGRRCSKAKPHRTIDCGPFREGTLHTLSNKIGEKACQHPEAEETKLQRQTVETGSPLASSLFERFGVRRRKSLREK